ncbi:MAG: hypothetical protein WBB01_02460 [Phormidesmis sp.]
MRQPFASHRFIDIGIVFCLGLGILLWIATDPRFAKRFVGKATANDLGFIRIIACIDLIITALWLEDLPTTSWLPEAIRQPMGTVQFLYAIPGFETFARSQEWLQGFELLTVLCLGLGMIGLWTRFTIPLGALTFCILGGLTRQYFYLYHQGLIVVYMLVALSFMPCGDGLSVDRWLARRQGKPVVDTHQPTPVYGWSRYTCWVVLVLAYLASGGSKLAVVGLSWVDPTNLRGMMYSCTLQRCNNYDWDAILQLGPHLPDFVFSVFGIAGTFAELAFVLVLFSKLARRIMPLLMVSLHLGIWTFQNILFIDFIILQLVFVDLDWAQQLFSRRGLLSRSGRSTTGNTLVRPLNAFCYPLLISVLSTVFAVCWFYTIYFYPLTGLHLFAYKDISGVVTYERIYAQYVSGETDRIYPEDIIPAQGIASYKQVTQQCFSKKANERDVCDEYLRALATAYNSQLSHEGHEIEKLEVQRRKWDFKAEPFDQQFGSITNRYDLRVSKSR